MQEFDLGWVPTGWTRGEKLLISVGFGVPSRLMPAAIPSFETMADISQDYVGMVTYDNQDRAKAARVATWLYWWNAPH